jgi:predicted nuclease of restriction endonuclease-like (RecB) superfamily
VKEDYYILIKNKLIDNEIYERVKDYSKERNKVLTYFDIGRILYEVGSKYGEDIIGDYSKKLMIEVGKKYNKRTLYRMKQLYMKFNNEKVSPLGTQLTWSHYRVLLPLNEYNEIIYYIKLVEKRRLTKRQLEDIVRNKEYYRLPLESRKKIIDNTKLELKDTIKDPIIIKSDKNVKNEKILQRIILEDIPSFLKSLGDGFTFIDNEYKIKIDDKYNYIDILLYNIDYNCYVVVELKVTEYKKEYVGQIQTYMNYCDKYLKKDNQSSTLGIILVKSLNKIYVEYSSNENIIAREYILFK